MFELRDSNFRWVTQFPSIFFVSLEVHRIVFPAIVFFSCELGGNRLSEVVQVNYFFIRCEILISLSEDIMALFFFRAQK